MTDMTTKLADVALPAIFLGPLATHRNYIAHIALENAQEYFSLVKRHNEEGVATRAAEYQRGRYFFNAVESFNNIPDHLYFDLHDDTKPPLPGHFLKALLEHHPFLQEIADMANAYKHAVRGNRKGEKFKRRDNALNAKDLATTQVAVTLSVTDEAPTFDVKISFEWRSDQALAKAWQFWIDYHNRRLDIDVVRAIDGSDPVIRCK